MDWVSHAISAFGDSVGIADLELDADGYALFTLEPSGTLCVHDLLPTGGSDVLITLAKPLPSPPGECLRRALLMADFRTTAAWQVQLAVRDSDLVVTLRMPRHSFMLSALEDAVEALFNVHERVARVH